MSKAESVVREIRVQIDRLVRPEWTLFNGRYQLMGVAQRDGEQTWWDAEAHAKIHVEPRKAKTPFALVAFDFDGPLVRSNGPGRYFWERRNVLMQEAGVPGDTDYLNGLQDSVWRWVRDPVTSAAAMIERIEAGRDKNGRLLDHRDHDRLKFVLEPETVATWAGLVGLDHSAGAATVIAARLDHIGRDMLRANPWRVQELAPFNEGANELMEAIPGSVPVAIVSGASREYTVQPILAAHAILGETRIADRVGSLVLGREDVPNHHKPDPYFYPHALMEIFWRLQKEGRMPKGGIEVANTIFFGDRIGGNCDDGLDMAARRHYSAVLVNTGRTPPPGPLSVVARDIPTLLAMVNDPAQCNDHVVSRLAKTLLLS